MTLKSHNPEAVQSQLTEYEIYLRREERSENTILKYVRDLRRFFAYLGNHAPDKEQILQFKIHLAQDHAPVSVNSMLAAVNGYLDFANLSDMKVKPFKIQRAIYAKPEKELTRKEYLRLVHAANMAKNHRLSLLLQTICSTGIRVSELRFITSEAVKNGRAVVDCKGKTRTVFLPNSLCLALKRYCRSEHINSGIIFRTRTGAPLDRSNIWKAMKALCKRADVAPGKVFPHNLRHLFAKTYYRMKKDLSRLADLLGHSNVCTTRIYTMESGIEHAKQLDQLGLVLSGTA